MRSYLLAFFCLFILSGFAQDTTDKIYWEQDGLKWADFRGTVNKDSKFDANTNAGLSFAWGLRSENNVIEFNYDVSSYFNPLLSWVKPESDKAYLLKHEQLHFDITELHARKLRKKLSEVNSISLSKDPKAIINRIYQEVENERKNMQLQFDKDSKHSLDKEGEARWQNFVRAEMVKYEEKSI